MFGIRSTSTLDALRERIQKRAKQKIEEDERQKRLGAGGLDPFEVMELLPKVNKILNLLFESQPYCRNYMTVLNLVMLFNYNLLYQVCLAKKQIIIKSVLWVPNAKEG